MSFLAHHRVFALELGSLRAQLSPHLSDRLPCQGRPCGSSLEWSHSSASDPVPCPGTQVEGQGFICVFTAEELEVPARYTRPFDSLRQRQKQLLARCKCACCRKRGRTRFVLNVTYYYLVGRTLLTPSRHRRAFRGHSPPPGFQTPPPPRGLCEKDTQTPRHDSPGLLSTFSLCKSDLPERRPFADEEIKAQQALGLPPPSSNLGLWDSQHPWAPGLFPRAL